MPYVERNQNGRVVGQYAVVQAGYAEEWLDDGHPDLLPTAEEQAAEAAAEAARVALIAAKAEAKADNIVQYLRDHTPAECAQYVQGNVTDLASAKAFLKKVAIVLCALSKESLR